MATPWTERNAQPGFGYAGGFQDILTAFNGLNHRGANVRYHDNQALLEEQIQHLESLKKQLEKDEEDFFRMFGIYHKDKKISFQLLKNKIDTWNATGAGQLINDAAVGNTFYVGLEAIRKEAVRAEISPDDWEALLSGLFSTANADVIDLIRNNAHIAKIINAALEKDKGKGGFVASSRSTLAAIKVKLDEKDNIIIEADQGSVSPSLQLKLKKEIEKYLEKSKQKIKPNYDFQKMFTDLFNKLGIDSVGQTYIKMALRGYNNVLDYYALNSSYSQIKGFLGEVYNNAFLLYMASNGGNAESLRKITPVGVVTDAKDREIAIDTWLDGFGIQVKNYEKNKVMKEGFKFRKSYNVGTFITEALQLGSVGTGNTASVGDILLNFFTAYAYNQDYGAVDSSVTTTKSYAFWKQSRERMESKFKDTAAFTNIFTPYIDKLIGIDKRFSSSNSELFVEPKEYRNSFFNISGNYIPSSVLVQAIIDSINKTSKGNSLFKAHFSAPSFTAGDSVWNPNITNADVESVFADRKTYADQSKISYTITLDMNELVNNLLNYIR